MNGVKTKVKDPGFRHEVDRFNREATIQEKMVFKAQFAMPYHG